MSSVDVGSISAPAFVDIDSDGDFDVFLGSSSQGVLFFENVGSAGSPIFVPRTGIANPLNDSVIGGIVDDENAPTFVDIDNDGDFDAFIGDLFGTVHFFRNSDPSTPSFTSTSTGQNPLKDVSVEISSAPAFADFDQDGDFDCMVGEAFGETFYYENTGSANSASFTLRTGAGNPLDGITVEGKSMPAMVDIDDDGDVDIFLGSLSGSVLFVETSESGNLDEIYVDFTVSGNGVGAIDFPFDNLADAVEAATTGAIIHIEPGLSSERFTGAGVISTAVTLMSEGGGTVRIGVSLRVAESSGGFVSRSGKARIRR